MQTKEFRRNCLYEPRMQESLTAFWSPSRLTQMASLAFRLSSLAVNIRTRLPVMPQELRSLVNTDRTSRIPSQQNVSTFLAKYIPGIICRKVNTNMRAFHSVCWLVIHGRWQKWLFSCVTVKCMWEFIRVVVVTQSWQLRHRSQCSVMSCHCSVAESYVEMKKHDIQGGVEVPGSWHNTAMISNGKYMNIWTDQRKLSARTRYYDACPSSPALQLWVL